ncbi:MAG: copper transporter [Streptosporangiaceae bacterium]
MIDFRYHIVSIVAIFLALAIGIVFGSTELRGVTLRALQHEAKSLHNELNATNSTNRGLGQQVSEDQSFATAAAPLLLAHLLEGQSVVLVTAPNADPKVISGVTTAVLQAGGTVTGQVSLQQQFFDTSATTEGSLASLAQSLAPPGTIVAGQSPPQADPQLTGQAEAARVLAAAIVTSDGPALPAAQGKAILAGFAQQGFLQLSKPALAPATLAVVIIPITPPAAGDSDPANVALISVTATLNAACQGAVLAGSYPGSGAGSAIDELASGNTGIALSSVDNANFETGQIMVVQALGQLLAGGKPASYGIAPGTVPSPAPTPSPTVSPVPSSSASPGQHSLAAGHRGAATSSPGTTQSPAAKANHSTVAKAQHSLAARGTR